MAKDDFWDNGRRPDQLDDLFSDGVAHLDRLGDVINNSALACHQTGKLVTFSAWKWIGRNILQGPTTNTFSMDIEEAKLSKEMGAKLGKDVKVEALKWVTLKVNLLCFKVQDKTN